MADTTFVPGTVIASTWLNDVNDTVYDLLGDGTLAPVTKADVRTNLGLGTMATQNTNAVAITGGTIAGIIDLAVADGGTGISTILPVGQCRLAKSGANIVLSPLNGNKLSFPAGHASVPSAGVSLAPTGLTVSTVYYIYAVQTAGVVTSLEASTTGHSQDSVTGIEIKTGDATRVLVGMVRPITGPAFQDTAAQRFVISWFSQRTLETLNFFTANRNSSGTAISEINSEIRNEFLSWATSASSFFIVGTASVNAASGFATVYMGIDGTAQDGGFLFVSPAANNGAGISVSYSGTLAEGYHYATLLGQSTANTATYVGSGTVNRTVVRGTISG